MRRTPLCGMWAIFSRRAQRFLTTSPPYNTTVTIQDGQVLGMYRIFVP